MTSRTFDVASYLRSKGSDSVEIQNISATDFEEYKQINEIILQGERLGGSIIVAAGEKIIFIAMLLLVKLQIRYCQWLTLRLALY